MKNYVGLQGYQGPPRGIIIPIVTPDIDGFSDEPVVCDVEVVEYTFRLYQVNDK